MTEVRRETDSLGVIEVPADKLSGAQTQRSIEHFSIGQDMQMNIYPQPSPRRGSLLPQGGNPWRREAVNAALEFGRFRVLLRQRQLLADGVPIELGTRAFDILLVLLEADGLLVTKEELLSRVWPGIVVAEDNLKTHVCALRKALGADRDLIRTEFGRGYRFTGVLSTNAAANSGQITPSKRRRGPIFFPQWCRQSPQSGVDLRR